MSQRKKKGARPDILQLTEDLAGPFAKAFATFIAEARRTRAPDEDFVDKLRASEPLEKLGREYAEKLHDRYEELRMAGVPVESVDFRELRPPRPTLKVLAIQKGVTQRELAKKTGMDAAVVSRVLKNPDRSKLATIKRIAQALGASLSDLNLDHA